MTESKMPISERHGSLSPKSHHCIDLARYSLCILIKDCLSKLKTFLFTDPLSTVRLLAFFSYFKHDARVKSQYALKNVFVSNFFSCSRSPPLASCSCQKVDSRGRHLHSGTRL